MRRRTLGRAGVALPFVLGCAPSAGGGAAAVSARKTMVTYEEVIATPAPPAEHREAYGPEPLHFGELRLPTARARVPVVVLIHGGCWRAAYDLAHVAPAAAALADAGYAVWVPEYRRVGDAGGSWPGTFEDVGNAVDHIRALAAKYPDLDTTRVVVAGHSAGGQLALWAASRKAGEWPAASGGSAGPLRVAGVVSLAGITDLAAYASATGCGSAVVPLMGGTAAQVPERYRLVSPIARAPLGVPVRFVHGASDPVVPMTQSRSLSARLTAAGEHPVIADVPGAGHFDVIAPRSTAWPAVLDALRALTTRR